MPHDPIISALDFERHLPRGQMWFTVPQVARHWGVSEQHVVDLVIAGRFTYDNIGPVDLSSVPGKTRTTTRIPRACILAFLQANKL